LRYITFSGFDFGTANNVPTVQLGANAFLPITNISTGSNPIPGIGQNATVATNLLTDLAGAVLSTTQTNFATGARIRSSYRGKPPFASGTRTNSTGSSWTTSKYRRA
jgi:hypothetical protein